jgi:hypothetical protein
MGSDPRTTYWREGLLLLGFLTIVGVAVVTVALPELSDAPHPDDEPMQAGDIADAGR